MDHRRQRRPAPPPLRRGQSIHRQPPAGIERHAETMHRLAAQQGLEPHRRCHRIDRARVLDQADRVARIADHPDTRMIQHPRRDRPRAPPGQHLGVDLDHHRAIGMRGQGRLDHRGKVRRPGQTAGNRQIPRALIGHQHIVGGQIAGILARRVVFGEPRRHPLRAQGLGAGGLRVVHPGGDHRLHPRWRGGIVIGAQIVDQHRQQRAIPHRAQKSVLQQHMPQPQPLPQPARAPARSLAPPAGDGIRIIGHKGLEMRDPRDAAVERQRHGEPGVSTPRRPLVGGTIATAGRSRAAGGGHQRLRPRASRC